MPLTNIEVQRARSAAKPQRLYDGGGLYLEVSPSGGKLWRFKYRFNGKEKRLAIGIYPAVSIALARKRRDEARELLAREVDPGVHRKTQKAARIERAQNSFEV